LLTLWRIREMKPSSIVSRAAAVLVLVLLAAGCSTKKTAHPDELTAALASENQHLREALAESDTGRRELEEQAVKLQMRLLEREAQLSRLRVREESLQKKIDDAILEAVRAKAKLRSLESRAEAASTMAEAEIAMKTIRGRTPERQKDPELLQVERFLEMSAKEFEKENYGGALYLASQAKNLLTVAQGPPVRGEQLAPVAGEILFAAALPLQITKTSNVREGPGLDFRVLATLEKGTRVTGYSYKGQWVRVRGDGLSGWVFQTLVSGQ
jgi:hypothetical protein